MSRLVFEKGNQNKFLLDVLGRMGVSVKELANFVGISERSLRGWINEKTLGSQIVLQKLQDVSEVKLPKIIEIREENWSGRINGRSGAMARMKIYGPPGNDFGRSKGGKISQQRRKEYPDYYRELGCIVAKKSFEPRCSNQLAEIVGVILGDGGITANQLKISLNSEADLGYDNYLCKSLTETFGMKVGKIKRKNAKAFDLYISGVNFVDNLKKIGLSLGNKVAHQVDVPNWIVSDSDYSKWCLRGLMDTDGGIFKNKYKTGNQEYSYLKTCFTNKSVPLIEFVYSTLKGNGFNPKVYKNSKVWLCSEKETIRYLKLIGSSNLRLNRWLK